MGGTGEMAQKLRELAALAEDLGLIPSTHMVAHTICSINTHVGRGREEGERKRGRGRRRESRRWWRWGKPSLSERCIGKIKVMEAPEAWDAGMPGRRAPAKQSYTEQMELSFGEGASGPHWARPLGWAALKTAAHTTSLCALAARHRAITVLHNKGVVLLHVGLALI